VTNPEAAAADTTDPEQLRALSTHRYAAVRQAVAENPATPRDVLEALVRDHNHRPRFGVADNQSSDAVQVALSAEDAGVRMVLCQRLDLPKAAYEQLRADPDAKVRAALATATDRLDLLLLLAEDEVPAVRAGVAMNDSCSSDLLERLSVDGISEVRAAVACGTRLGEAAFQRLARDRSAVVRWWLLQTNPDRQDLIALLVDDSDAMNAGAARDLLR
jgi:hypothetical protein